MPGPKQTPYTSLWSGRRFVRIAFDVLIPAGCYLVVGPMLGFNDMAALCAGLGLLAVRIGLRTIFKRDVGQIELLALLLIGLTLVSALISGQPRVILAARAADPLAIGLYVFITILRGRPLLLVMLRPLFVRGDHARAHAWQRCWDGDDRFRRRITLLTHVWAVLLFAAAVADLAIALALPVGLAVASIPVVVTIVSVIFLVVVGTFSQPLRASLRRALA